MSLINPNIRVISNNFMNSSAGNVGKFKSIKISL